jgi:hypothetical protein
MDSTWVLFLARQLSVELSLDGDNIVARPAWRLEPELRTAIRENKQMLVKDLLMRDALRFLALRFLNEHYAQGANLSVLDPHESRINDAYHTAALEEYRAAIREYVKAGLREFRRARNAMV